jgi:phage/plasmid-associated DNA primase
MENQYKGKLLSKHIEMETNNIHALPLMLTKRYSVLDGLTLFEKIPVERIRALLISNLLLLLWSEDYGYDTHKKQITENYANEKQQIQNYYKLYNLTIGGSLVKYGKPKHKWGRAFPYKSLGLSCFRKIVRNTLINDYYYDFDLKNAQPEIIRLLCESNTIPCSKIQRYCTDRTTILAEVQQHYGVNRDIAKGLFIRLCFFGSFVGWCIENKIANRKPLEFITDFERELKDIAERVKKENPALYETARKKKEDNGVNQENKVLGSFFGLYNQEYESRIVEAVLCYIINHTDLMNLPNTSTKCGAYEYDGIKLLKDNVDLFEGGLDAVIELLNTKTLELTGFKLEWTNKPFEDFFDLDEWIEQITKDEKPNDELVADMTEISSAIQNSDCGVIETLVKIKPQHYIFSVDKEDGSKGEWYGWNDTRWEKSDAPLKKAIMYNVPEYWRSLMKKWDDEYLEMTFEEDEEPDCNYKLWKRTRKSMEERIFMLKSAGGMTACVSVAKTIMANYTLEFDAKEDLFGCENGVLDFAEECFRPYRFDDFITYSCGYDYTPTLIGFNVFDKEGVCRKVSADDLTVDFNTSFDLIMDTYKKIFPDEELRNYFFKVISTGLSGRAIEKFFIFNGAGRNGKGLTNEFLEKVFGSYCVSVSPTIFSENQKIKSSAGANPEIAKLDKKRYIVSKEPQKDAPLHNNIIKNLTGGGNASGRMLYSSKSTVKLCGTNVMECNDKPPFSEAPIDADAERINDILFGSFFTGEKDKWDSTTNETNYVFPLDAGLKDKLKSSTLHKNTMLNILIQNLLLVKAHDYDVDFFKPESVKLRSLAYLQNSYDIHNIFISVFEKRCEENKKKYMNWKNEESDTDWTLAKIAQAVRKAPDFYDLPPKKQKEYKAEVIEEFFRKNSFYKTSVYMNTDRHALFMRDWRKKPAEDNSDDDDETL